MLMKRLVSSYFNDCAALHEALKKALWQTRCERMA